MFLMALACSIVSFDHIFKHYSPSCQVKRSGEMHRKLRFFKEQILKAGISNPSETFSRPVDLDELEVPNFLNSFQISFV